MPKVDTTGQPITDDPEGPDELRGGKVLGDSDLDDASANGTGAGSSGAEYEKSAPVLPGEKGSEQQ